MSLSVEQFNRISAWMYRNARPLDLARWQYHFEEGSSHAVIKALEAYQNEDGGFGHGLEADCWNPHSTPLQTWWASQFIKEIDLDSEHPMIQAILTYLDTGDGTSQGCWLFSVPSNNDYPRAPWWSYRETDDHPGYNPTAALAGFILLHSVSGSELHTKGLKLAKEAIDYFMSHEGPVEMHELTCFIELYTDLKKLPDLKIVSMEIFKEKLQAESFEAIEQDSQKWASEYCCQPSHLFGSAKSVAYEGNEKITEDELAFMIESLSDEGTWEVTWEWGAYEDAFAVSKRWWQGNIAIQNVRMLEAFGRLED